MSNNIKRIFVGLSGGVDSSVAAHLLKNAYRDSHGRVRIAEGQRSEARYSHAYDVTGVYLLCYSGNEEECRAKQDMEDARAVAHKIQIPFYVWNLAEEYKTRVIDYMVEGYRAGITPNPDVMCNREIKFGIFLRRALAMGADYVATGHYTRRREIKNQKSKIKNYVLANARDLNKDQSYFLWTLTQDQLKHCLFPIGDYTKPEVREIARRAGLPTAEKKDSQGVCFLGKIKLPEFLVASIPERRGNVVAISGEKIGEHNGAEFYTIGQRHLGISNMEYGIWNKGKDTKPYYVAAKDIAMNTLTVAEGDNHPLLYKKEIELTDVNFISHNHQIPNSNIQIPVLARIRYRQPLALATLFCPKSEVQNSRLIFAQAQKFVAPGQSAVFYIREDPSSFSAYSGRSSDELRMLGGGIIV